MPVTLISMTLMNRDFSIRFKRCAMLLVVIFVAQGLVSCTKKLEQKSADLQKQVDEARSKQREDALDIMEIKTKQNETDKSLGDVKAKLGQIEGDARALAAKVDESKGREQKLSDDVNKLTGKLDQAIQMIRRMEQDMGAIKHWQEKEERRQQEEEKKADLDRRTKERLSYAKASLDILEKCERALEAAPYLAATLLAEVQTAYKQLQNRFPTQKGAEIDEKLSEVLENVKNSASGETVPVTMGTKVERMAHAGRAYQKIPTQIDSVRESIYTMLDPKDRLKAGPESLR